MATRALGKARALPGRVGPAQPAGRLARATADEILPRLRANDVPSAPVLSRFELLSEPQVRETRILEEHTSEVFGRVRQPRPAAIFDRTPAVIRTLAPMLGADTEAILGEIGYSAQEIASLEEKRIVFRQNNNSAKE